jgi:PKD repeat protein
LILNNQPSHTYRTLLADIPPVASFIFAPLNPITNASVSFDASASIDSDGTIATYAWDFNDTVTATAKITSHSFASARTFHVKLTVTDNAGLQTSIIIDVPVTIPNQQPIVTVTAPSTSTTGTPVTISLTATGTTGTVTAIKVDWGDGTIDNLPGTATTASHTYTNARSYNITVTATDSKGLSATKTTSITVAASPGGIPIIAFIAIPIVAIIAAAIVLLMRKRKPTNKANTTPAPAS